MIRSVGALLGERRGVYCCVGGVRRGEVLCCGLR